MFLLNSRGCSLEGRFIFPNVSRLRASKSKVESAGFAIADPTRRCMPPAQNSVIVLQMEESPALAASMARTLTAVYLLSAVPMAILISATLEFVDKAEGMQ